MSEPEKKVGIFFTGGGGIGSFHIGVLDAMDKKKIKYQFVAGCSAGAIVAGGATYLTPDELKERWNKLTPENTMNIDSSKLENVYGIKRIFVAWKECVKSFFHRDEKITISAENIIAIMQNSIHDDVLSLEEFTKQLEKYRDRRFSISSNSMAQQLHDGIDGEKIRESDIGLAVSTTHFPSMKIDNTRKEEMVGDPTEYIYNSMNLPFLSRNPMVNGKPYAKSCKDYVDLCRFRDYPLEFLLDAKVDLAYVVNIERRYIRKLAAPMEDYFRSNGIEAVLFNCTLKPAPSMVDFSAWQRERNYKAGHDTTMEVLNIVDEIKNYYSDEMDGCTIYGPDGSVLAKKTPVSILESICNVIPNRIKGVYYSKDGVWTIYGSNTKKQEIDEYLDSDNTLVKR